MALALCRWAPLGAQAAVYGTNGTVWAWGVGGNGRLGNNATANSAVPVAVSTAGLPVGAHFVGVGSGPVANHSLALIASPAPVPAGLGTFTNAKGSVTSTPALLTVVSSVFQPPARRTAAAIRSSGFSFDLAVEVGRAFRVQGSTNLQTWVDLTNFTSTGLAFQFLDAAATNQTRRFYRVVSP